MDEAELRQVSRQRGGECSKWKWREERAFQAREGEDRRGGGEIRDQGMNGVGI